jgi:hypothetical protein
VLKDVHSHPPLLIGECILAFPVRSRMISS